ncbi:hypothetical protein T06_14873 [Trichinella sp. T6]|nr:hypothetical protein T06_14873 [Trichinella sp. T6]
MDICDHSLHAQIRSRRTDERRSGRGLIRLPCCTRTSQGRLPALIQTPLPAIPGFTERPSDTHRCTVAESVINRILLICQRNAHTENHTADADVCSQKLRKWRRQGVNVALIDLKKAYLQIRIDKSLWPYQTVVFNGKRYCLTRLGFGLNVAPLVMKAVLNCASL